LHPSFALQALYRNNAQLQLQHISVVTMQTGGVTLICAGWVPERHSLWPVTSFFSRVELKIQINLEFRVKSQKVCGTGFVVESWKTR
jgi:hypothetical protein